MQTSVKTKIGPFLVIASVLAVWTLLAAQPVQAHSLTNPSCSGLPGEDFLTNTETAALSAGNSPGTDVSDTATPKKGTGESGQGNKNYYYAKITVPPLTAGKLVVRDTTSASATYSSEAILCGRQEGNVSSLPSYASAHINADNAADAALRAQATAAAADTTGSAAVSAERNARSALISAANALASYSGTTLVGGIAHALRRAAAVTLDDTAATALNGAADQAITDSDTARRAGGQDAIATTNPGDATDDNATTEAAALTAAAEDLRIAAHALDPNMVFNINTLISSGDEEYVVVMTVPEGGTPAVTAEFMGVMSTVADALDGDNFTLNNQRFTRTLRATDPGLLIVRTTGREARTTGTLEAGGNNIAMDGGSGGNFEIISPMDDDADYSLHVDGQTRGERGKFGLEIEFGVATDLTIGTAPTGTELQPGRADYFFFTISDTGQSFLTVETQTSMGVTPATDTTGTLFSQQGLVATDTDSGRTDNNFLLRAPVSAGDYIVEVKGARSSTEGAYVLETASQPATNRGSAPNMLIATPDSDETLNAGAVVPYSIAVNAPGTLQVKTTGSTDTVGVLYGPDGQQIWADDNSGDGMNFLITRAVEAGQHIVTVEGQGRTTTGMYTLVVNFVEGVDLGVGTGPGTGTGTGTEAELRNQIAELERDLAICEEPIVTDATGNLGNPSGARSGIGLISGWVCEAEEVEIRIFHATQGRIRTLNAAYGTSRPDTAGQCQHDSTNTGFGMTFNFNQLPEGNYTIQAFADDEPIGVERAFSVNHLVDFATADLAPFDTDDNDRFLRGLTGTCSVENFPTAGDTTRLEWEQSLQNFTIINVQ